MDMDSRHRLVVKTPEGIVFSMPLAGPVSRFLAWLIDRACVMVTAGVASSAIYMFLFWFTGADVMGAVSIVTFFLFAVGYNILMEWYWRGQTIGKSVLGLRVIDEQGLRLRLSQIVLRNLLRFVDSLPGFYLVGGAACLVSRRAQRLGDFAANTIVVRKPIFDEPDLEQIKTGKFNSLKEYPHLAARLRQRLGARQGSVALQALVRREELDPAARVALYAALAEYLRGLVAFPPEAIDGLSDEQYIRNVVEIIF